MGGGGEGQIRCDGKRSLLPQGGMHAPRATYTISFAGASLRSYHTITPSHQASTRGRKIQLLQHRRLRAGAGRPGSGNPPGRLPMAIHPVVPRGRPHSVPPPPTSSHAPSSPEPRHSSATRSSPLYQRHESAFPPSRTRQATSQAYPPLSGALQRLKGLRGCRDFHLLPVPFPRSDLGRRSIDKHTLHDPHARSLGAHGYRAGVGGKRCAATRYPAHKVTPAHRRRSSNKSDSHSLAPCNPDTSSKPLPAARGCAPSRLQTRSRLRHPSTTHPLLSVPQ